MLATSRPSLLNLVKQTATTLVAKAAAPAAAPVVNKLLATPCASAPSLKLRGLQAAKAALGLAPATPPGAGVVAGCRAATAASPLESIVEVLAQHPQLLQPPRSSERMQVFVKDLKGKTLTLNDAARSDTVAIVKAKFEEHWRPRKAERVRAVLERCEPRVAQQLRGALHAQLGELGL